MKKTHIETLGLVFNIILLIGCLFTFTLFINCQGLPKEQRVTFGMLTVISLSLVGIPLIGIYLIEKFK